jgi:NADPH-dependent curcumin reductase CurA
MASVHFSGCKVIGFAGDDNKLTWLKDELKFDQAFNYKKVDVHATLQKEVPQGVNCYFDNVSSEFISNIYMAKNVFRF